MASFTSVAPEVNGLALPSFLSWDLISAVGKAKSFGVQHLCVWAPLAAFSLIQIRCWYDFSRLDLTIPGITKITETTEIYDL